MQKHDPEIWPDATADVSDEILPELGGVGHDCEPWINWGCCE